MQVNNQTILIKQSRSGRSEVDHYNNIGSCGNVSKTSDVIKDILYDIVENVITESETNLNIELFTEVGLSRTGMRKMHVKEISIGNTTASYPENVFKVNNKKNGETSGSKILAEKKKDCGDQTSSTAIKTGVSISENKKRQKCKEIWFNI